jgi:uncharacterized iron-regulated membrane protein
MWTKKLRAKLRSSHRWIGVIVGVQLSLWVISGFYFAWISIDDVKGDSNKVEILPQDVTIEDLYPPGKLLLPLSFKLKSLKLELSPKGYVYRLESKDDKVSIFGAVSGTAFDILSHEEAIATALTQVKKQSGVKGIVFVEEKGGEYKGPVPVYRIQLDDWIRTRLYVDPWTAKLIVQRNSLWRVYDFLWMLHIMDYSERENFNNPLIKILTLAALGLVISGYLLFYYGRPRKKKVTSAALIQTSEENKTSL